MVQDEITCNTFFLNHIRQLSSHKNEHLWYSYFNDYADYVIKMGT